MKIGIFFTNETRSTAEEITRTLIKAYPYALEIKESQTEGISCYLENGDIIRMVRMNECARGNKFDIAYVPKIIDIQYLNDVIRHIVLNEIKFYQVKEKCGFCRNHEKGDTLYEMSDWDGGVGFDYIHNIKYCPICGKELK